MSSLCRLEFISVCRQSFFFWPDIFFFDSLIGRLWSIISGLYLSPDSYHYVLNEVQWTRTLFSILSFRTSDRYLETLDSDALVVNKFVYAHSWTSQTVVKL